MDGKFLVVEGPDGVGKTTLASRLAKRLRAQNENVIEVREPGGTPIAEAARAAVLDPALDATPHAELFLMLAARADLVERVIRPALLAGKYVLGDRYELSTVAYQIEGRGLQRDAVLEANRLATGGLSPDLTLVLDASEKIMVERMKAGGKAPDRIELVEKSVRDRIIKAFREATGSHIVHLDATVSADMLEEKAWDLLISHGFFAQ